MVRILKGNLIPVNDKHRKIIKNSFRYIYERLSTTDIVPFLLSAGVINYFDTDEIHAVERTQGRGKAVIDLLLMLPNRRRDWFPAFIKALIESGQTELADIIDMDVSKSKVIFWYMIFCVCVCVCVCVRACVRVCVRVCVCACVRVIR